MNQKYIISFLVILAILGFVGYKSAFVVGETEQVIITRFNQIVREPIKDPGLNFKIPFIEDANYFPKNLQGWDGDPDQIPTNDKTYLWVDTFARWEIADPRKFFETVRNTEIAKARLDSIIDPAVRNIITDYKLIETVRNDPEREMTLINQNEQDSEFTTYAIEKGRGKITVAIQNQAKPKLEVFGINLVDVKIKRVNYVDQVREKVYERMIAERKQMAEEIRSEGKGEAQKILGKKDRELKKITSEAYEEAQKEKGKADAEAAALFAEAFGRDPEFYSFVKTLEIYREALDDSSLILSTDSDLFKYLKGYSEEGRE